MSRAIVCLLLVGACIAQSTANEADTTVNINPKLKGFDGLSGCNTQNFMNNLRWKQFESSTDEASEIKPLRTMSDQKIINKLTDKNLLFKDFTIKHQYYAITLADLLNYLESDELKNFWVQPDRWNSDARAKVKDMMTSGERYVYYDLLPNQLIQPKGYSCTSKFCVSVYLEALLIDTLPVNGQYLFLAYSNVWTVPYKNKGNPATDLNHMKLFMNDVFQAKFGVEGTDFRSSPTPSYDSVSLNIK